MNHYLQRHEAEAFSSSSPLLAGNGLEEGKVVEEEFDGEGDVKG